MSPPKGIDAPPQWVDAKDVLHYKKLGATIAPIRLRSPGGQENMVNGASAGRLIDAGASIVEPGQEQQSQNPMPAITRNAIGGAIRQTGQMLPALIPGAGIPAAIGRLAALGVGTTAGDISARATEGQPQNIPASLAYGVVNTAVGVPFEAAGFMGPRMAPGMAAGALRPTKSQQVAAEAVAARQGGQPRPQADYERLGRQMLQEDVLPSRGGAGMRTLQARMDADNAMVEGIIDQAGRMGMTITAPQLVRSQEVRDVMRDIRMQANPKDDLAYARSFLRGFMEARSTGGAPARPSGVLNSRGQMIVTPAQPRIPNQLSPTTANLQKRVWREESTPVLNARQKDNPVGPQQTVAARLTDALARAAKARFDAIPIQRPDPENPGQNIGVQGANERIERRVPLEQSLQEFGRRIPPTRMESLGRMLHGHLLAPESEARLAQTFYRPEFQNMRNIGPLLAQLISQQMSKGGGGARW